MTSNSMELAGPDIRLNRFLAPFIKKQFQRKLVLIHCPTFNFETFQFEVLRKKGYYAYPPDHE